MKITLTHSCSHRATVNLFGSASDRDRKAAWLRNKPCRDCERAAVATTQAAAVSHIALPALSGSEKQVAWATKIRNAYLVALDAADAKIAEFAASIEASTEATEAQVTQAKMELGACHAAAEYRRNRVMAETSAAAIIDGRNCRYSDQGVLVAIKDDARKALAAA